MVFPKSLLRDLRQHPGGASQCRRRSKGSECRQQRTDGSARGPTAQDYTGPVLFEARAAAPLLAQILGPAVNGSRPPVSFTPVMEQMLSGLGGKSDWVGRLGSRVLPASVSLVDDPGAKDFQGQALLGKYAVDEEGVRAQKVTLVENGNVKNELMSRRPGPDFEQSNGHGRAAFLNDAKTHHEQHAFLIHGDSGSWGHEEKNSWMPAARRN